MSTPDERRRAFEDALIDAGRLPPRYGVRIWREPPPPAPRPSPEVRRHAAAQADAAGQAHVAWLEALTASAARRGVWYPAYSTAALVAAAGGGRTTCRCSNGSCACRAR
jgi:hypothetical protein